VKGEIHQTNVSKVRLEYAADRSPALNAGGVELSNQKASDRLSGVGGEVESASVTVSGRGEAPRSQPASIDIDALLLQTAKREFTEETGIDISNVTEFIPLGKIKQRGGKIVHAWAFHNPVRKGVVFSEGSGRVLNLSKGVSTFEMEWPPRSGQIKQFPEIDTAEWFTLSVARQKINPAQIAFLDRLVFIVTESYP